MLSHLNPVQKKPERVVILGAHGFISRHLRDWFGTNGIDCLSIGSSDIDLTEMGNAQRLAALLRAGDAVVMASILTPEKGRDYLTLMRNLRMAETVCNALAKTQCAHFVYLSSDAVYDAQTIPLDEKSTREPIDYYALCHTAREMMFGAELDKHSIPFCILRPTAVYGPGDTHNAYGPNRFVRTALKDGRIELFGGGEELRSHVYIDDIVRLITLALARRSTGVLNIAIQPAVSFLDIAKIVIEKCGKDVNVANAKRVMPIIHRTFVNSALFDAFPEFCFTPLEKSLSLFLEVERLSSRDSDAVSSENAMTRVSGA